MNDSLISIISSLSTLLSALVALGMPFFLDYRKKNKLLKILREEFLATKSRIKKIGNPPEGSGIPENIWILENIRVIKFPIWEAHSSEAALSLSYDEFLEMKNFYNDILLHTYSAINLLDEKNKKSEQFLKDKINTSVNLIKLKYMV